jgi:hypothetical protein
VTSSCEAECPLYVVGCIGRMNLLEDFRRTVPLIAAQSQRDSSALAQSVTTAGGEDSIAADPARRGRPVLRTGTTVPVPHYRRSAFSHCSRARVTTRKILQPHHHLYGFEIQIPDGLTATFCSGDNAARRNWLIL